MYHSFKCVVMTVTVTSANQRINFDPTGVTCSADSTFLLSKFHVEMVTLMLISVVLFWLHIFLIADLMSGLRKDIKKTPPK